MSSLTLILNSCKSARTARNCNVAMAIALTCGLAFGSLAISFAPAQAQGPLGASHAHNRSGNHYDGFNPYASPDYERRRAAEDNAKRTRQREAAAKSQRAQAAERRRAAQSNAERVRQREAAAKSQRAREAEGRRVAEEATALPEPYTPPKVGTGPLGPFLYDTSLRQGDVVVTEHGLMVFAGRDEASQHSRRDFLPLSQRSRQTGSLAVQLRAIENSNSVTQNAAIRIEPASTAWSVDGDRRIAEATSRQ